MNVKNNFLFFLSQGQPAGAPPNNNNTGMPNRRQPPKMGKSFHP